MPTNVVAPETDLPTDAELIRQAALALAPLTAPATRHLPEIRVWIVRASGLNGQLKHANAADVERWAEYLEDEVQHNPFLTDPSRTLVWCQGTVMDFPVEIWTEIPTPANDSEAGQ